jgi:hypothetical protein
LARVRALERRFQGFTLKYILRAENTEADELAKAVAIYHAHSKRNLLPDIASTSKPNNHEGIQDNPDHRI